MPRIFGLIPTTEDLPFAQQYYQVGGGTVANNGSAVYTIGTFTMPWDGELFASMTSAYYFTGFQQVTHGLSASTPAPTTNGVVNHVAYKSPNPLRSQLPLCAYWAGLTKGQIVTLKVLVQLGGGGPSVTYEIVAGTVRAVRVGL